MFGSCALSPLMLLHQGYYAAHRPTLSACWKSIAIIGALNGLQSMRYDRPRIYYSKRELPAQPPDLARGPAPRIWLPDLALV